MDCRQLKHMIRELKTMELVVRFGYSYTYVNANKSKFSTNSKHLIWDDFFCLCKSEKEVHAARYSLHQLEAMDQKEFDKVLEEFWFYVYYQTYKQKGMTILDMPDPELVTYLNLPMNADGSLVRKRFHELCKKYHPDEGGNADEFIKLMNVAKKFKLK